MMSFRKVPFFLLAASIFPVTSVAQTTGTIRGTVKDPSGLVVSGARVTVTWQETNVSRVTTTGASGDYEFPVLAVGHYTAEIEAQGFKKYVQKDIDVTIGHVVVVDAQLQLGSPTQVVTVTAGAPLVETTSTQLGAVVNDRAVTELPLNARDTYQLLQLQPGVQSQLGSNLFYGSDQAGVVSVNGGRGRANNYMVNGGDANDQFVNLPVIQPSPDAIQEFRVLTNTFDAEFGRNSGGVVNVVTKTGTNNFHGDVFEFFRNKVLNARNFFDLQKGDFKQNQFGGTLGGPIIKDHTFIFGSYEGRRIRRGVSSGLVFVPTPQERAGDFSADTTFAGSLNAFAPFFNSIFPSVLEGRTNCRNDIMTNGGTAAGAALDAAAAGNPEPYSSIFVGNHIPSSCFDPTALDLLNQFVPPPIPGTNQFASVPVSRTRADQSTVRFDHKINDHQQFSAYYYFDDDSIFQAFSFFQAAGANVPGFGGLYNDRFQQWNLTHSWTLNPTTVNEARFSYFREGQLTFDHPQRTNLVQNSCVTVPSTQCFAGTVNGNNVGISPNLGPNREGVPFIMVSGGFNIGNNFEGELPQVGNTFQWADSLTKILGNHTMKFGGDARRQRFDQTIFFDVSGEYFYFGGGPNDLIATDLLGRPKFFGNYLLGLPDSFLQSAPEPENLRSTSAYVFAQDSWKLRSNLTLNYGLRWELNTPYSDVRQKLQTFRAGQDTTIFPCQLVGNNPISQSLITAFGTTNCNPGSAGDAVFPRGMVFPGDKGIPNGLTQTYYKSFAPRVGLAWSPQADSGLLRWISGGPGKMSVRTGWGMFYNPTEQLVLEQGGGAPYAGIITLSETLFNTPFEDQFGTIHPNSFGFRNLIRGNPVDLSIFRPITLFGVYQPNLRSQYAEQYNLTVQRELAKDLVFQIGYVGSQGHRLLASHDLNPGNAQTCLDIRDILGPTSCGPFFADVGFFIPAGTVINTGSGGLHLPYNAGPGGTFIPNGTTVGANGITIVGLRPFSSPFCQPLTAVGCSPDFVPVFGSIFTQDTIANSNYNSLQFSVEKRFSHGLQFLGAYTWSQSIDEASSFENILNPLDFKRSRAESLFNSHQRFVLSYDWELPVRAMQGFAGKLLNGWAISGITTFQSGFPIRITSSSDLELENSFDFELPGQPDIVKPFHTMDPHGPGHFFFDPTIFANQALGTIGNAPRAICCGPGINNFDFAIHKNTGLTEQTKLQFRAEFFNLWNHTQFLQPDGNITDTTFGEVLTARDPRLIQFALKLLF